MRAYRRFARHRVSAHRAPAAWLRRLGYGLALLAALSSGAAAEPALEFDGPQVLKLDWATRALNATDLNNDGLQDLALVNNDRAQLELLYQRDPQAPAERGKTALNGHKRWVPDVEDAGFERASIAIGFPVFDLAVGDLNGDGRDDLVYSAREVPLTVRYQGEDGKWNATQQFDGFDALGWKHTLKIADLDGDQRAELLVMSGDALRVFNQDDQGQLQQAELYYVSGDNPFNLLLEDVNEDGRLDVLYVTTQGDQSLVLREQLASGGFGAERRFVLQRPVRAVQALRSSEVGGVSFCALDSRNGGLEFFRLQPSPDEASAAGTALPSPEIYPIFKAGRQSASYALGDLDGDGQQDLLVANPDAAELVLFLQQGDHFARPQRFPSLSAIRSITSGRFFSQPGEHVVVISAQENTLGLSHLNEAGRLSFPRQLGISAGDPLVCQAVDLDADGADELALVTELDGELVLTLAQPSDRNAPQAAWTVRSRTSLTGVKRKPVAIRALDIFADGRRGLMVFVPREAPLLLAPKSADAFELAALAEQSTLRESLLKGITQSQVSVFDVDGDGVNELIVGRTGYARALRVEAGELEMVDQFNARRGDDAVSAVVPIYADGQLAQLVFYVAAMGEFQALERDRDGVFRYRSTELVGTINLRHWQPLAGRSGSQGHLFAGADRFWRLPTAAKGWTRVVLDRYETRLEAVHYSDLHCADFDGDGLSELVALDGKRHLLELLAQGAGDWGSRLYWQVFEQNLHYQGRQGAAVEPRQVLVAELSGDDKLDIALLVHDRVLIYPQQ